MKDKTENDWIEQSSLTDKDAAEKTSQGVSESRRALTKAGFAAPALITLASQPVFGAQCLSQMMSGNMSHQGAGNCSLGWSPGAWKNPVGQIAGMGTIVAWTTAGYQYSDGNGATGDPNQCENYTGGTLFSATALSVLDFSESRPLRQILCEDNGSEKWHCVAAFLNASLSANLPSFKYILSVPQVIGLCDGSIPVPGGLALNDFLDSTWS